MLSTDSFFELGKVVKLHGVKGEIQLWMDVEDPNAYMEMESVFLEENGRPVPFFVDSFRLKGKNAILRLEGIDSAEKAQELIGRSAFLPESMLPELSETGFYYHEIIGYTVVDASLGELGEVLSVYESPGQDLIAMRYKGHEVLIPILDEVVLRADREKRTLHTDLPDGLIELYLEQ